MNTPLSFTPDERNAMRAFVARAEVRLSTMHRIITAFISGAGLLVLIPIFFKDVIEKLIGILIQSATNFYPEQGQVGIILTGVLYFLVIFPILMSLSIPLYALYLLLKDIVHFYFTVYMPGYLPDLLNPSLSTSPILFSVDESSNVKREIMRYQYTSGYMNYMLPFSTDRRKTYFDSMIESSNGSIIPQSRHSEQLTQLNAIPDNAKPADIQHFNAALGIVRAYDRQLVEEVAQIEMTMVRSALYIRRMLLRYVKALLMFIWTMVVLFVILPIIEDQRIPVLIVLALAYVVWSMAVIWIIRLPIGWIYRHRYEQLDTTQLDPQLTLLEQNVKKFCYLAFASSIIALFMTIPVYF